MHDPCPAAALPKELTMAEDFWARALRREARSIDLHNNDDVPELGADEASESEDEQLH